MCAATVITPYYKEHKTNDYLSKTFESDVSHTPAYTSRRTVSNESYLRNKRNEQEQFKTPWGRKYSYGGVAVVQLPNNHRPKDEPPLRMQKGSFHFGSGICLEPRGIPIQQFYALSKLQKSDTRVSDELVPSPTKVDISKHKLDAEIPQEHPYKSHQSSRQTNIFPIIDAKSNFNENPLSAETPAEGYPMGIKEKGRGSYGRHELNSIPLNSQRKPMTWPGGPSYFKILKGSNREKQVYYPVPSTQRNQSQYYPPQMYPKTAEALKQLRLSQWQTSYQQDYNRTFNEPYLNLDTEETLVKITAGPNARIPRSLMIDAVNECGEKRTVEEISAETSRKARLVHFEEMCDRNKFDDQIEKETSEKDDSIARLPRSIMKGTRPLTSFMNVRNDPTENLRLIKSASERPINDVASAQSWSKSDYARKFNVTYYNDETTNLYDNKFPDSNRVNRGYIRTSIIN